MIALICEGVFGVLGIRQEKTRGIGQLRHPTSISTLNSSLCMQGISIASCTRSKQSITSKMVICVVDKV